MLDFIFCLQITVAMAEKGNYEVKTAPFDARFPNQNQTRYTVC